MSATASNASQNKPAGSRLPFRQGVRRLHRDEIDRIAARRVRLEFEARQEKTAATRRLNPAMVGTGILAGVAFVFSVLTVLNQATQDKVDKATAPLAARTTEMGGHIMARFNAVDQRMDRLEVRVDKVEARLAHIDSRLAHIDSRLAHIESRLERFDARFDAVDKQFESINTKLNLLLRRR
jgi:septal ring factor EnvC (AmiA/AmiB activator)